MRSDPENERRFRAWWEEHRGVCYRLSRAYAPQADDQADLLQDMAVQLWRSLPGFKEQCRPVTWVYRVCLNTALGWQRGERVRQNLLAPEPGPVDRIAGTEPRPGWTQEKEELLERLYVAIRAQPPEQRTILLLSLDGLGYREIAELTGLTENHVGVTLTRARQKLAEQLKEVRDEL
jgi:RNA polymerase sigma-70 factor (ECF subfamily)